MSRHDRPWTWQKQYFWMFWDSDMLCIFDMSFILICQVSFDNTIVEIHVCILCHERQLLTSCWTHNYGNYKFGWTKIIGGLHYTAVARTALSWVCPSEQFCTQVWTYADAGCLLVEEWWWGLKERASRKASCMQHAGDAQRHNSARAASA